MPTLSMTLAPQDVLTALDTYVQSVLPGGHVVDTTVSPVFDPSGSVTITLKQ